MAETTVQSSNKQALRLSLKEIFRILVPYVSDRFLDQVKSVWLIITYLLAFQLIFLRLPIVDSVMIATGVLIVILGLMLFMEGLILGLMPFGEIIGSTLPKKAGLFIILSFAFILGMGATFAEPAIATLQLAGRYVSPGEAPLLYSLLNDFSGQLVFAVGIGVGIAVIFGVLRFLYQWSLKLLIYPLVILLAILTYIAHSIPELYPIIGLAWDCGAVTTGPVTVPLVLALGIGVSRIVSGGDAGGGGFGIVTLASLFPILAVLGLGFFHYSVEDYYGASNYKGTVAVSQLVAGSVGDQADAVHVRGFSDDDFQNYLKTGKLPDGAKVHYTGETVLENGTIRIKDAEVIIRMEESVQTKSEPARIWDPALDIIQKVQDAAIGAVRAILPLCLFLFVVLRYVLREKVNHADEITLGIVFALVGMGLFTLGIFLALDPLGGQVGKNVAASFATIQPYGLTEPHGPLYGTDFFGRLVVILFSFVLGYGATLAEPALNALGVTVEKITVGAFKKGLLMQAVALGVGVGIALGVVKLIFALPLFWMLIPPYILLIFITAISSEDFVNFAWDSAGVTTGPITVPLVLAMGLGIGGTIGATEGFGVLAMASVCPIISVLTVGLLVRKN